MAHFHEAQTPEDMPAEMQGEPIAQADALEELAELLSQPAPPIADCPFALRAELSTRKGKQGGLF